MERSVTWTESAADEFDDAATYRAQTSKVYASAFAREVRAASRSLRTLAERGRIMPELGEPTIVQILIGEEGELAHAELRTSIPLLNSAALQCVREWRFRPARRGGKPVPTIARAPVTFVYAREQDR